METMELATKCKENPIVTIKANFNMFGSTFCVHRAWFGWNNHGEFDGIGHIADDCWAVSEYNTGATIPTREDCGGSPKTRKQAIKLAKDFLNNIGSAKYYKAFRDYYGEKGYLNIQSFEQPLINMLPKLTTIYAEKEIVYT